MSGSTSAVASLRRKYKELQGVALTLQNLLDDVATQLERLHACITWQDPSATLLFIGFCACAAMALTLLGLPTVMAFGLFWMVGTLSLHEPHTNALSALATTPIAALFPVLYCMLLPIQMPCRCLADA